MRLPHWPRLAADPAHGMHRALRKLDLVLTYGGGPPVVKAYEAFGAKACKPIYNALSPGDASPGARRTRASPSISHSWEIACRTEKRGWKNSCSSLQASCPRSGF